MGQYSGTSQLFDKRAQTSLGNEGWYQLTTYIFKRLRKNTNPTDQLQDNRIGIGKIK